MAWEAVNAARKGGKRGAKGKGRSAAQVKARSQRQAARRGSGPDARYARLNRAASRAAAGAKRRGMKSNYSGRLWEQRVATAGRIGLAASQVWGRTSEGIRFQNSGISAAPGIRGLQAQFARANRPRSRQAYWNSPAGRVASLQIAQKRSWGEY